MGEIEREIRKKKYSLEYKQLSAEIATENQLPKALQKPPTIFLGE